MAKTAKTARTGKTPGREHETAKPVYGATYRSAKELGRLVLWLLETPGRRTLLDAAEALTGERDPSVLEKKLKTTRRYLAAIAEGVLEGEMNPNRLVLLDKHGSELAGARDGKIPLDRIHSFYLSRASTEEGEAIENVLPTYLAFTALQLLEPVLSRDELDMLWEQVFGAAGLSPGRMGLFHKKFFSIPFAAKDYTKERPLLDTIVAALARDRRLVVTYGGVEGKELRTYRVEPLTLAAYKEGLYLLGQPDDEPEARYFAIDRINEAEIELDDDGEPVQFAYPRDWDPAAFTREPFGIVRLKDEEPTRVVIRIRDDNTRARLEERRLHPTARIRKQSAEWILTMEPRGVTELVPWVLGWGSRVEVLEPAAIRDQVARELRDATASYDG